MRSTRRLVTEAVDETRYLSAKDNTQRYRLIMRYFYEQHLLHHYTLTASQVLQYMRAALGPGYTEDDCQQDLKQLVDWRNLEPDWELGLASVRTIDDFRRRNVVYGATPDAIAIEALMVELERRGEQVGELDSSAMSRLWEMVLEVGRALGLPPDDPSRPARLFEAWRDLWLRYDFVASGANNYMGNMRRQERERLLSLDAFQVYKGALIQYLTRFVEGLATYRERIFIAVSAWDATALTALLADTALTSTRQFESLEHCLREYRNQVESLAEWFAPGGSADQLRAYASHAIERVARSARRLSESRHGAQSRAQDLLALADRFHACTSVTEADRVATLAFGLKAPIHWRLEVPEQVSDQPELDPWRGPALPTAIRERRTQGRRKEESDAGSQADLEARKALLRSRERERQQETAALVDRLFANGPLVVSELRDLNQADRDLILSWVYDCLSNAPAYATRVAEGATLGLANPEETRYVWLRSEDGKLLLPDYRLERRKEG